MHHVVGEVLVEVGEGVGVLAERLVLPAQPVARRDPPELDQVNHIERADVVGPAWMKNQ